MGTACYSSYSDDWESVQTLTKIFSFGNMTQSYGVKLMRIPWIVFNTVFSSLATEEEKKDKERKKHKGGKNSILNTERSDDAVLSWFQYMSKSSANTFERRFYSNQQVWRATRRGCDTNFVDCSELKIQVVTGSTDSGSTRRPFNVPVHFER